MNIKQFFSKVLDYCVVSGESLDTRNVINVAVREFPDTIIINKFDNHDLYYQSRWHISKLRKLL